jgi:hypothetical protein
MTLPTVSGTSRSWVCKTATSLPATTGTSGYGSTPTTTIGCTTPPLFTTTTDRSSSTRVAAISAPPTKVSAPAVYTALPTCGPTNICATLMATTNCKGSSSMPKLAKRPINYSSSSEHPTTYHKLRQSVSSRPPIPSRLPTPPLINFTAPSSQQPPNTSAMERVSMRLAFILVVLSQ